MNIDYDNGQLIFLPIGGSQEIGMNANLYHYNGTWILVDCGVQFGGRSVDDKGLNVYTPDLLTLKEILKNLSAVFITHGHDDHIGSLRYLPDVGIKIQCPVYSTLFTAELIKARFPKCNGLEFEVVEYNKEIKINDFSVKFIRVTHSIPSNSSLMIETPCTKVFHSGDWRFDDNPVIGEPTDYTAIERCKGVDFLVCDSTNIVEKNDGASESSLYDTSLSSLYDTKGRIFVTCFSSNVARVVTYIKLAKKIGRKPLLLGRSIMKVMKVAVECGLVSDDLEYYDCITHVGTMRPDETLIICTGSQGEPNSALQLLSSNMHNTVSMEAGDKVVFSSRIIPGNERSVYEMCNTLTAMGIDIITNDDCIVHVGGHPSQSDVKRMYDLLEPKCLIPVHGEFKHVRYHKKFAEASGIKNVIVPQNGMPVNMTRSEVMHDHQIELKKMTVDGNKVLYIDHEVFQQRSELASAGVITVVTSTRPGFKTIVHAHGILNKAKIKGIIKNDIKNVIKKCSNLESTERGIKSMVCNVAHRICSKRPYVQVVVV